MNTATATPWPPVPDGYLEDSMGRLVPLDRIDPIDLQRNDLVNSFAAKARIVEAKITELKREFNDEVSAHVAIAAEEFGVKLGGERGNLNMPNYAGTAKFTRTFKPMMRVGEQILAAEEIMRNLINTWTDGSGPEVAALIERAFTANAKGNISVSRLLDLKRANIKGDEWKQAVDAIDKALYADGETVYYRVYERATPLDSYRQITLDLSAVVLPPTIRLTGLG